MLYIYGAHLTITRTLIFIGVIACYFQDCFATVWMTKPCMKLRVSDDILLPFEKKKQLSQTEIYKTATINITNGKN